MAEIRSRHTLTAQNDLISARDLRDFLDLAGDTDHILIDVDDSGQVQMEILTEERRDDSYTKPLF